MIYPKPYSIYLRGIEPKLAPSLTYCTLDHVVGVHCWQAAADSTLAPFLVEKVDVVDAPGACFDFDVAAGVELKHLLSSNHPLFFLVSCVYRDFSQDVIISGRSMLHKLRSKSPFSHESFAASWSAHLEILHHPRH